MFSASGEMVKFEVPDDDSDDERQQRNIKESKGIPYPTTPLPFTLSY
jgi:hypothetical protein